MWVTGALFSRNIHVTMGINQASEGDPMNISNHLLLEAYAKAMDLRLEADFLDLLHEEIRRRRLESKISYYCYVQEQDEPSDQCTLSHYSQQ